MTIPVQIKNDPKVIITWTVVLGVIVYAFISNRISWEVMLGYLATLGVPSLLMSKRDPEAHDRRTDRPQDSEITLTEIVDTKESGQK